MRALLFVALLVASSAFAQRYTVVSSSSGGDIGDIIQRAALSKIDFVPEYSPGADGLIAPNKFAAKPRGRYLLMSGLMTQQVTGPAQQPDLVEYSDEDMKPVTMLASTFFVVLANKTVDLSAGRTAVSGNNAIFVAQLIGHRSKRSVDIVRYKGIMQGISEMLNGDLQYALAQAGTAYPFVASGKAHAVATTAAARVAQLPDTPTLAERFPGLTIQGAWGLYGQRWMAPAEVARLTDAVTAGLADQTIFDKQFLYAPAKMGPDELSRFVAAQRKDYLDLMAR